MIDFNITEAETKLAEKTCIDCGGLLVYGEPLHAEKVTFSGESRIRLRCRECSEVYAWQCWPDDQWGPYPFTVHQRTTEMWS